MGKSTIAADVTAIRESWRARARRDFEAYVAEELAKLDQLERRVLPLALAGPDPANP